jgi:hypothetical protein
MPDSSEPELSVRDFLYEKETVRHLLFYSAIGRIIVLWGELEAGFGIGAMMLYQLGGDALTPRPPYQLSQKIKFWRRCFEQLPDLAEHRKGACKFADEMAEAARDRDAIVHNNWNLGLDHDRKSTALTLAGRGIVAKETGHHLRGAEMSLENLYKFTATISDLRFRMLFFTMALSSLQGRRRWHEKQQQPPETP